jgi:hypothetical protein|tara:strand:+ start:72 stop:521 length:450 start_codon:yes stop_codon:yes gene_type:complete
MNKNNLLNNQMIMFLLMFLTGIFFNPMNILAFRLNDLYFSLTLFYGGLLMASNMIWAHEIYHYFSMNKFDIYIFFIGILLSVGISILLLRSQFLVDDTQWLKRMISHHSTALTSSHKIYNKTNNIKLKKLAKDIIETQENEIYLMKSML